MDLDLLFAKRANHIKPGLERIKKSYEFLGEPAGNIPAVLIGGTNGKGSTSGFLWSLLAQSLSAVGLYTSPHLMEWSERFQISGRQVDDQDAMALAHELESLLPADLYAELSFFELTTLIAFRLFEREQVAMQVLEVGLGGRWDASNVADPLLSVVVSVSLDHQEYLGQDLRQILMEKLGIMRAGRPLFWGRSGEITALSEHREWVAQQAAALGCPLILADEHFHCSSGKLVLDLPNCPPLRLACQPILQNMPDFLQKNLALAAAVYHYLASHKLLAGLAPLEHIWNVWQEGHAQAPVTLLGRSQRILAPADKGGQALCLDVCHNPDGARHFRDSWRKQMQGLRVPALVSVLRDKDFDAILDILRAQFEPIFLYQVGSERTWSPELLAPRHQDLPFSASLEAAWGAARADQAAKSCRLPWVLCGSVFAIGQLLQWLGIKAKDMHVARVIVGDWTLESLALAPAGEGSGEKLEADHK